MLANICLFYINIRYKKLESKKFRNRVSEVLL